MFNHPNFVHELAIERVYNYFLQIVKEKPPQEVLLAFQHIFIDHHDDGFTEVTEVIRSILVSKQESLFVNTLKRSCYILVNNWDANRHYCAIHQLVELFKAQKITQAATSSVLQRLRTWLRNFVNSEDYQVLRLFITKHEAVNNKLDYRSNWSQQYTAYLLVCQYTNQQNSLEQREVAKTFAKKLKDQFKFDLARYTAHLHSNWNDHQPTNPTRLGDDFVRLLEKIIAKKSETFSYQNLAKIFIHQNQEVRYEVFKSGLKKYLFYSSAKYPEDITNFQQTFTAKIESIFLEEGETIINEKLLLRTCQSLIDFLVTEDWRNPSAFFGVVIAEGHGLTLSIILLKIILICESCRGYLESAIAVLIRYYQNYSESECFWFITFLEILTITLTIHAENIEYNLVPIAETKSNTGAVVEMNRYRIFSQLKKSAQSPSALVI